MIPWLERGDAFPHLDTALRQPNGLLAASADLSVARLRMAYAHGIFPWFNPGDPILWWSPDPRMVLRPAELHVRRSLRKRLKRGDYEVRVDTVFRRVLDACSAPRDGQAGTWITDEMIDAYCALHTNGYAHSVETWIDGELVGGLYGVALGRAFFGESMFTRVPDASKIAFVHLVRQLERWGFALIDCQMRTDHLASFGAKEIPRRAFASQLAELIHYEPVGVGKAEDAAGEAAVATAGFPAAAWAARGFDDDLMREAVDVRVAATRQ
ncbi:MAG: leucyl/phenylalanyl-tRNA--protein transferase [Proteobacteria bacterium]|nr:leucyl/phenylalanyl-tRNA--protein transferase [Burkholderiales bacterium]